MSRLISIYYTLYRDVTTEKPFYFWSYIDSLSDRRPVDTKRVYTSRRSLTDVNLSGVDKLKEYSFKWTTDTTLCDRGDHDHDVQNQILLNYRCQNNCLPDVLNRTLTK